MAQSTFGVAAEWSSCIRLGMFRLTRPSRLNRQRFLGISIKPAVRINGRTRGIPRARGVVVIIKHANVDSPKKHTILCGDFVSVPIDNDLSRHDLTRDLIRANHCTCSVSDATLRTRTR